MATWGSMLKAPGNIVSGIASGTMKAVKYTIYGAVVCGLAVMLNQFASNAFGMENWAAKGVDWLGDTVGPMVSGVVNWLGSLVGLSTPTAPLLNSDTIGNLIGGTTRSVSATGSLANSGTIGTLQGWANSIGETVGSWIGPYPLAQPGALAANTKVANAVLAAGGTAAVVGTTVGKWQAAEDQRRAQRAQALQQLG